MRQLFKQALFYFGLSVSLSAVSSMLAHADNELPQYTQPQHLGVATCANSMCHAVTQLDEPSNVHQDEYLTWLFHDRHAGAYNTLLNEKSKSIAKKMGLKDAASADICLDCHADNVPAEKRGVEFHITDGVGCEACHGGAETWIKTHTVKPYDAARNYADGMYPTAPLDTRAKLCVSCHVGNEKKLANHNIMGAGHPRLSFELDTFSIRQPEHHTVDDDYVERKNRDNSAQRLLIGTAVQAQTVAMNLTGKLVDHPQGHPEVALFDCHSCHHSLKDLQWQKRPSAAGLKPGAIRLNDSSFILLAALSGALDKPLQDKMLSGISALHTASSKSVDALKSKASNLLTLSLSSQQLFENTELSEQQTRDMLNEIMRLGVRGEYRDYIAAEQAVMAMDALSYSLPPDQGLSDLVNMAYEFTKSDDAYRPEKLRKAFADYLKR